MYNKIAKEKFNKLRKNYAKRDIVILAIESSCDETSVAVVRNGRQVLSNIISSQIEIHKRFGGVVPEVASRNHVLAIENVVDEAITTSGLTLNDIDAVAVTYGAGLVGALMVGVNYAKSLAYALQVPLIKVNHIKGHMSANYINYPELTPPFMGLIVSGGHTALVRVDNYVKNTLIGTTTDDAVGEAYDKVSKVLGLGYPGGPIVDKMARKGKPNIQFVKHDIMAGTYNFSYSGLKTAVINYLHNAKQAGKDVCVEDVCASFQHEAVMMLVDKTISACRKYKFDVVAVAGGVAANSYLREKLTEACNAQGIKALFPQMKLCTDNAAMIASEAYFNLISGEGLADLSLTADPNINLKYSKR